LKGRGHNFTAAVSKLMCSFLVVSVCGWREGGRCRRGYAIEGCAVGGVG